MTRAALRARVNTSTAKQNEFGPRRQVNTRPTSWEHGEFVAVDGEGFSDGEPFEIFVGAAKSRYTGKPHYYAYLSASDGSAVYAPAGRLTIWQCLEFLCGIVERNPRAIPVVFGGSYDVTQMLAFGLTQAEVKTLLGGDRGKCIVENEQWTYVLEYRPRKCLTVQRWQAGARRWSSDAKGKKIATPHLTVRLWDVWGFFQDSFVGVMKKWVPDDPDYQFIKRMKGERSIFERSEIETIKTYNAAELRILVKIMNRVRDAINDLGLKITRWDGAGAIAAAMMAKHKVKQHKMVLPDDVFHAARCAYSGGHIETCKVGYHNGPVYHYDVNSAYPDQFRRLPSLANGHWERGTGEPPTGYTMVKVEFKFPEGLPFYPLFHRCDDGSILYPYRGCGWYWHDEYIVAKRYFAQSGGNNSNRETYFRETEWFHFRSLTTERPFGWVEDYYTARQNYIEAARRGGFESGPEKIIKLGCNSLYGKTAQQIGARYDADGELRLPPYFQLDWAGFVTAGCRAKLMAAAIANPSAIIGFATDGLFSTAPIDLYCPERKELGAWEFKLHVGGTFVMPGVYWLYNDDADKPIEHFSRGFDKREMKDAEFVHDNWRRRNDSVAITINRLVGMGTAAISKDFWRMRGCFVTSYRSLCLDGDNSKRLPIALNRVHPEKTLIDTTPRDHEFPDIFGIPQSAPFPIAWLDGELTRDLLEGELADELEQLDAELA